MIITVSESMAAQIADRMSEIPNSCLKYFNVHTLLPANQASVAMFPTFRKLFNANKACIDPLILGPLPMNLFLYNWPSTLLLLKLIYACHQEIYSLMRRKHRGTVITILEKDELSPVPFEIVYRSLENIVRGFAAGHRNISASGIIINSRHWDTCTNKTLGCLLSTLCSANGDSHRQMYELGCDTIMRLGPLEFSGSAAVTDGLWEIPDLARAIAQILPPRETDDG